MVNLREESDYARGLLHSSGEALVPLPVAAALAFRESHAGTAPLMTRPEYDDALNMAAAALSRLLPIYAFDERSASPVLLQTDLGTGRFLDGAAVYEHRHPRATMTSLFVPRDHLPAAMEMIRTARIPFQFAAAE